MAIAVHDVVRGVLGGGGRSDEGDETGRGLSLMHLHDCILLQVGFEKKAVLPSLGWETQVTAYMKLSSFPDLPRGVDREMGTTG
jgi:hypothetical protein